MPRSLFLPILGLVGIVVLGTTRAGQPDPVEIVGMANASAVHDTRPEPQPVEVAPPPPPPAPRLRSEIEAEERAAALADTVGGAPDDTARARLPRPGLPEDTAAAQ